MQTDSSFSNDKNLLEELFSGNQRAGRVFLERFGGLIHAAVQSVDIRSNTVDHEDLFMDALGHLFEDECKVLKSFKWSCKLSAFLYLVSRRFILDKIIHENKLSDANVYEINLDSLFMDSSDDFEDIIFSDEQRSSFNEAFKKLDPKDALFIRMLVLEKQPAENVMNFFGWNSVNTVYARKNKLIGKLKSLFRKALQRRGIIDE